jgi:hypothetical protein
VFGIVLSLVCFDGSVVVVKPARSSDRAGGADLPWASSASDRVTPPPGIFLAREIETIQAFLTSDCAQVGICAMRQDRWTVDGGWSNVASRNQQAGHVA